jgi:hypothetical protein
MREREVTVWTRDAIIRAIQFKAKSLKEAEAKTLQRIAEKIKNGDVLIILNPDRDRNA